MGDAFRRPPAASPRSLEDQSPAHTPHKPRYVRLVGPGDNAAVLPRAPAKQGPSPEERPARYTLKIQLV
jgi:hypothetical protein